MYNRGRSAGSLGAVSKWKMSVSEIKLKHSKLFVSVSWLFWCGGLMSYVLYRASSLAIAKIYWLIIMPVQQL